MRCDLPSPRGPAPTLTKAPWLGRASDERAAARAGGPGQPTERRRAAAGSRSRRPNGASSSSVFNGSRLSSSAPSRAILRSVYPWPLKPFDRSHPVRGYFNDPRISGTSRAFHFGIDISAPNGTPVYAVRRGVVHLEGRRSLSVADGDLHFGYWHVIPAVAHHERVAQHQLLGHVEAPWLHVHFAERRAGLYRDPLRPGALAPWRDATAPQVTRIVLSRQRSRPPSRGGRRRRRRDRRGAPDAAAPRAGALGRASRHAGTAPLAGPARRPHRAAMAHADRPCRDASSPGRVPARLRAGHAPEPCGPAGLYRFFLARTWSTGLLADAGYVLEVEATSLNGRTGRRVLPFTIANDV